MSVRLAQIALDNWASLDGFAVARNMPDLRTLPQERFDNFVWWWATRNADEKQLMKFKTDVWRPPKGVTVAEKESPWHPDNETAALASFQNSLGT